MIQSLFEKVSPGKEGSPNRYQSPQFSPSPNAAGGANSPNLSDELSATKRQRAGSHEPKGAFNSPPNVEKAQSKPLQLTVMKMGSPDEAEAEEEIKESEDINDEFDEQQEVPGLRSLEDLKDLKYLLQDKKYSVGIPFCTNILRIALNFQEEKIAR